MADLNLSNQAAAMATVVPEVAKLLALLEARRDMWDKLPLEYRRLWATEGKDPVVAAAWQLHLFLTKFFEAVNGT